MSSIGTEGYVQLPPDSTGKKVRTTLQTDDFGNTVESEVVQVGDSLSTFFTAGITATREIQSHDNLLLIQQQMEASIFNRLQRVTRNWGMSAFDYSGGEAWGQVTPVWN